LASKSAKVWKYEFLAARESPDDFDVLSSSEFQASNLATAKSILANAVTAVKPHGSAVPNAIRLIDPDGREIWRARIAGPRPAVRRPVRESRTRHHAWLREREKRRGY